MNISTSEIIQRTAGCVSNAIGAMILLLIITAIASQENRKKSTVYFLVCCSLGFTAQSAQALAFYNGIYLEWAESVVSVLFFISYVFPFVIMIPYILYEKAFLEEKSSVNKKAYIAPLVLSAAATLITIAASLNGTVYTVSDGAVRANEGLPLLALLMLGASFVWAQAVSLTRKNEVGIREILILSVFGVMPGIAICINGYISMLFVSLSLTIVYVLLQNDITSEQIRLNDQLNMLNRELEERQILLEKSVTEHETQLEQIKSINAELGRAYGTINGFTSEYYAIWLTDVDSGKIHMLRNEKGSNRNAVNMALELPDYPTAAAAYVTNFVDQSDQERMMHQTSFDEVLLQLEKTSTFYTVNYLRRDPNGKTGYHQIAYANADTTDGKRQFVYGFRDIDDVIKVEKAKKEELVEARKKAEQSNERLMHQLNIIDGISLIFRSIYYMDMASGTFTELGVNTEHISSVIGSEGNTKEAFVKMNRLLVSTEFIEELTRFTDVDTLNERMGNRQWISSQFQSVSGEWLEGFFIAARRDEEGQLKNVVWAIRSINEQKLREIAFRKELELAIDEAEQANRAKSSFLFNMSHDIRTPMNAIIGYTELLKKHRDDPDRTDNYLRKIEISSQFLLSLINNVLEMARIESGKAVLDETTWSTAQFNDTLLSVFSGQMKEKNISFESEVDVEHEYVFCDPVKLREIFLNILSNAVKYTPEGGRITMSLKELPSDREGYAVYQTTISDTGIGMSKEFLPHLFDEFERETTVTENKTEGTGLGMSIVKKYVELMDGNIQVESELGKGTTFTVTVYHRISSESALKKNEELSQSGIIFNGKRILLAEDNDLNAEIAVEILSDLGLIVDRACDGVECVDMMSKAEAGYYDMILMDIQMPRLNGYGATEKIRHLDDKAKSGIPIFAMTANAFDEDKKNAYASGMNGHLAKPINIAELTSTLQLVLK